MGMSMGMGMGMVAAPAPQGRGLRQHSIEEELYNTAAHTPRSERVVGGRMSRAYEAEVEVHSPRSRRRAREERPRSSDMAGLSGHGGQGMNRVSQWRSFVEPGVPEGESTVGHA
ncbi:E3 ubiquitin-protein ligase itt1 [Tolypocladium capitatum]|uniref:E3 ubiquitin-protein ligase itt1 n=1 Tax=Tolypocladium capitatum TaxID=45235 RepID=A0A2K3QJ96_9HYPO|nr:E3 ubiquitin-protein ligase itt1 [Tolypocladium capitatum]